MKKPLLILSLAANVVLAAGLPFPDVLVDVDGHRLRARVLGDDGPTVVLESSLGGAIELWGELPERASAFARVVAYDRAGVGESEPGPEPRSPQRVARELHALLEALELEPPYVLVAHSIGGLHVRAFASLCPDEVAAFVFSDASHERQELAFREVDAEAWAEQRARMETFMESWPAPIRAEWDGVAEIFDSGELPGVSALPDVPTVVLTGTKLSAEPEWVGRTPAGVAAWTALQREWVAPQSNALHVLVDDAEHWIHHDRPDIVLAAVREACRVVREGGELSRDAIPGE